MPLDTISPAKPSQSSETENNSRSGQTPDELLIRPNLEAPSWLTEVEQGDVRAYLNGLPLLTRYSKRALDIAVALFLLVVTFPVMAVAAIAIKLTSPGPIIFTQVRVGLNNRRRDWTGKNPIPICRRRRTNYGRPFVIYKLRSMHVSSSQTGPSTAQQDDNRVFRVGRLMRKMRIDELPQLINVLKGEMSMVGPRPECIDYMEDLTERIPNYIERLGLKPGLTGIAQIEAGYANDLESYRRKISLDLIYLRNCSFFNDVKILVRTARVVVTGFGAL